MVTSIGVGVVAAASSASFRYLNNELIIPTTNELQLTRFNLRLEIANLRESFVGEYKVSGGPRLCSISWFHFFSLLKISAWRETNLAPPRPKFRSTFS